MRDQTPYWETETLRLNDRYNEYLMTALRTKWGVDTARLAAWGAPALAQFEQLAQPYCAEGLMQQQGATYTLTDSGKFLADAIISDLFWVVD